MVEVASVLPGSTAERYGIHAGDLLVTINGSEVRDSLDYRFLVADEWLSLVTERQDGVKRRIRISKDPDDTLGIELKPFVVRRCRNRCIFCFVDQMPSGCRRSLYVRDEDYRASFLFGNYITLGNLSEEDWDRIFAQRLSPLYVSVHATEPDLRRSLLGNKRAPDVMAGLRRLAVGGISVHTQIVLCPGINDGAHLIRTINDLATLVPAVRSIAAVPVGLTRYRKGLVPLRRYRPSEARQVIRTIEEMGARFRKRFGSRLVFPSDEFYIQAAEPFPPARFYEDFPQIENGVGMVAEFLARAARVRIPLLRGRVRATVITGMSFAPVLRKVLQRFGRATGVTIKVLPVTNRFFGPSVTVAGLLAGRDIVRALRGTRPGTLVLVPANALREDSTVFIDDLSLEQVEQAVGVPVRPVLEVRDLVRELASAGEQRKR